MSSDDYCDLCNGKGTYFSDKACTYCNGTGNWNQAAQSYVKNHECQCIFLDREHCPICHKICHHDTSVSPKQIIDDGFSGMGNIKATTEESKEIEVVA